MFGEYKCLLKQRVSTPNETREGCSYYAAVAKLATVRKKKKDSQ